MRIVAMSDSHNQHRRLPLEVPDGDVFVHAGDFTCTGREGPVRDFAAWVRDLPHRHKLIIAGNHDIDFGSQPRVARGWLEHELGPPAAAREVDGWQYIAPGWRYLHDEGVMLDGAHGGVKFWGSPYTPAWGGWEFQLHTHEMAEACWSRIPLVDVLITHGPPHGVLDRTEDGRNAGCPALRAAMERIQPRLHLFGHIHPHVPSRMTPRATDAVHVQYVGQRGHARNATLCVNVAVVGDPGNRMLRGASTIDIDFATARPLAVPQSVGIVPADTAAF